jgi:hypothetical protein
MVDFTNWFENHPCRILEGNGLGGVMFHFQKMTSSFLY